MRFGFFLFLLFLSFSVFALSLAERQRIKERIKPIGEVSVAKLENQVDKISATREESGQAIYEQYCHVCHQDGIAGAPKFRDTVDWKPRLDNKTIDDLVATANKGLNAMPMKGTCMQCTDNDLKNAIQFMLPQS